MTIDAVGASSMRDTPEAFRFRNPDGPGDVLIGGEPVNTGQGPVFRGPELH